MSALDIQLVTVSDELSVKQQRSEYAKLTRQAIADEKRAAITAGCYLTLGQATFTQAETDDWREWATSVTGRSYKTVESYLAVARAYSGSTKTIQSAIGDWTFEALQAFASVPKDDRKAVVEMVRAEDTNPTPELVRTSRDIVKDEALTEAERNDKAAAKRKRDKANAASKTEEMVTNLKPFVRKLKTDEEWAAFAQGILVGRAYRDEKIVEDAIKQYRQTIAAGTAAVQTAAANLVAKTDTK